MTVLSIREYNGFMAQQVEGFEDLLRPMIAAGDFARILEIGTGYAGFTRFLRDTLPETPIISWDTNQRISDEKLESLKITFRNQSAMEDPDIPSMIQQPGRSLVICDGGNKISEFRLFSQFLKPRDVIMTHDYCRTREEFMTILCGKIWNWLEITDADVADSVATHYLLPVSPELQRAAWGCWVKEDK